MELRSRFYRTEFFRHFPLFVACGDAAARAARLPLADPGSARILIGTANSLFSALVDFVDAAARAARLPLADPGSARILIGTANSLFSALVDFVDAAARAAAVR